MRGMQVLGKIYEVDILWKINKDFFILDRVHDNLAKKVVIVMHRTDDDDVYVWTSCYNSFTTKL